MDILTSIYRGCPDIFYLILEYLSWRDLFALLRCNVLLRTLIYGPTVGQTKSDSRLLRDQIATEVRSIDTHQKFYLPSMSQEPRDKLYLSYGHAYRNVWLKQWTTLIGSDISMPDNLYQRIWLFRLSSSCDAITDLNLLSIQKNRESVVLLDKFDKLIQYGLSKAIDGIIRRCHKQSSFSAPLSPARLSTMLSKAIKYNHVGVVKMFLSHGARIELSTLRHLSSLIEISLPIIEILLLNGTDVMAFSTERPIRDNQLEILKYLIDHGRTVRSDDLALALFYGHLEIAQYLCDLQIEIPRHCLTVAVRCGRTEVVRFLLQRESQDNINRSFHDTCIWGNFDIVLLFLEQSVEITPECMHLALQHNRVDLAELFFKRGQAIPTKALSNAVVMGQTSLIRYILSTGYRIDDQALHRACQNDDLPMLELLINAGADVSLISPEIIESMKYFEQTALLEYLRKRGVSV